MTTLEKSHFFTFFGPPPPTEMRHCVSFSVIGLGIDITDSEKLIFWIMRRFWSVSSPGQADFVQQRHLRRWAENFQKMGMKKLF